MYTNNDLVTYTTVQLCTQTMTSSRIQLYSYVHKLRLSHVYNCTAMYINYDLVTYTAVQLCTQTMNLYTRNMNVLDYYFTMPQIRINTSHSLLISLLYTLNLPSHKKAK